MKVNKKTYLQPNTTVLYVEAESILAGASVEPQENGGLKREDYNTPNGGTEHNGGSEEWQRDILIIKKKED